MNLTIHDRGLSMVTIQTDGKKEKSRSIKNPSTATTQGKGLLVQARNFKINKTIHVQISGHAVNKHHS